jgi:hypothetical protein
MKNILTPKVDRNEDVTLGYPAEVNSIRTINRNSSLEEKREDKTIFQNLRNKYDYVLNYIESLEKNQARNPIDSGSFASFIISDYNKYNKGFMNIPVGDFDFIFTYLNDKTQNYNEKFSDSFKDLMNKTKIGNKYRAILLDALTKQIKELAKKDEPAITVTTGEYAKETLDNQRKRTIQDITDALGKYSENPRTKKRLTNLLSAAFDQRNKVSLLMDELDKILDYADVTDEDLKQIPLPPAGEDLELYQFMSRQRPSATSSNKPDLKPKSAVKPFRSEDLSDDLGQYYAKTRPNV